jgi:23S rRNA (adenine2503-C2)-methyltransferase
MEKILGMNLAYEEWQELLKSLGEPAYRGDQICQWIYEKKVDSFEEMTNLSKDLRILLEERVTLGFPRRMKGDRSRDGTKKYLWAFRDDATVESVLMRHGQHRTACLSSQVGCPLDCAFCATGSGGFQRNLEAGEIVGQFLAMEKQLEGPIQNIVFMGMGEPLLNEENLFKSIRMLQHPKMRQLGIRHITVSTAGIVRGIEKMALLESPPRLAVSLHAVDDALRSELMPVNRIHSLEELRRALFFYQEKTGDRITIEYLLLRGVNEGTEHARALASWLRGLHVFVNLIPYNEGDEFFRPPFPEKVMHFQKILEEKGMNVEVRRSRGGDIAAACGQLKKKDLEEKAEVKAAPLRTYEGDKKKQEKGKERPRRSREERSSRGEEGGKSRDKKPKGPSKKRRFPD